MLASFCASRRPWATTIEIKINTGEMNAGLILRVASRRDAQNEASIHFPRVDLNFMVVAHSPRPPPWPRN